MAHYNLDKDLVGQNLPVQPPFAAQSATSLVNPTLQTSRFGLAGKISINSQVGFKLFNQPALRVPSLLILKSDHVLTLITLRFGYGFTALNGGSPATKMELYLDREKRLITLAIAPSCTLPSPMPKSALSETFCITNRGGCRHRGSVNRRLESSVHGHDESDTTLLILEIRQQSVAVWDFSGNTTLDEKLGNASAVDTGHLGIPLAVFIFDTKCDIAHQLTDHQIFVASTNHNSKPKLLPRRGMHDEGDTIREHPSTVSLRTFLLAVGNDSVSTTVSPVIAAATGGYYDVPDSYGKPALAALLVPILVVLSMIAGLGWLFFSRQRGEWRTVSAIALTTTTKRANAPALVVTKASPLSREQLARSAELPQTPVTAGALQLPGHQLSHSTSLKRRPTRRPHAAQHPRPLVMADASLSLRQQLSRQQMPTSSTDEAKFSTETVGGQADVSPKLGLAAIEPLPPFDAGSAVAIALLAALLPSVPAPDLSQVDSLITSTRAITEDGKNEPQAAALSVSAIEEEPGPTARQNLLRSNELLVQIIDTAGQHEYSVLQENAIRTADVHMLVFAVDDLQSFEEAKLIFQLSRRLRQTPAPTVLVANKVDRRDNGIEAVDHITAEAATWAEEHNLLFIHTSARTPLNVCEAFQLALNLSTQTQSSDKPVSIGLLGAGGVGKSSLRLRYTMGVFVDNYDPTIEEIDWKLVQRQASTDVLGAVVPGGTTTAVLQDASRLVRPLGDGHEVRRVPVGQNPTFDTNILSLDLGSLGDENFPMLNIERLSKAPSNCENCGAVIEAAQACSLCDRETRSADEELHRRIGGQNVIEYDLVSEDESDTTVVPSRPDDGVTLFCIDVSGSMQTKHEQTELQGLWSQLRNDSVAAGVGFAVVPPDLSNSRLDYMKDTVSAHLNRLKGLSPHRKVAIISFSGSVSLFVAGLPETTPVRATGIDNLEQGLAAGRNVAGQTENWPALATACDELRSSVSSLTYGGATALGLTLAVATGITSQASTTASHEIFLCTDGDSNIGIGKVGTQDDDNHGRTFYHNAGTRASQCNTKVNVIGIAGEGVALDVIAAAAQASGGLSSTVDIHDLRRGLRAAAQRRVAARDVEVTLRITDGWVFKPDTRVTATLSEDSRVLSYTQAQADDTACVSFAFAPDPSRVESLAARASVTIQATMVWTTATHGRRVRVLEHTMPVTSERAEAETQANVAVVTMHVLQQIGSRMNRLLAEGPSHWTAVQEAALESRALLESLQQMLGHVEGFDQREEAIISLAQIESLDRMLAEDFGRGKTFPQGSRRDETFQALDAFAVISRDALTGASRRTARVLRANELR